MNAEPKRPSLRKIPPQRDWSRDPRGDSRYAFKIFPPIQIIQLTIAIAADCRLAIADSNLGAGGQRFLSAILRHVDYPTRVCARRRRYLLKEARIVERWAAMLVAQFEEAGILTRLRYDAKHPDLHPPREWELKGTDEWELGCWLLRWEPTFGNELAERLRRLRRAGGARVQGDDLEITRGMISRSSGGRSGDHPGGDLEIIPSFARRSISLDPDLPPVSQNPLNPPTSALDLCGGDLAEPASATPTEDEPPSAPGESPPTAGERAVSPSATRLVSAEPSLPPSEAPGGSRADERGKCNIQTEVARPGATSSERTRIARETYDALSRIVGGARRRGVVPVEPGGLLGLLVNLHKACWRVDELEAFVAGVERGEGEAAAARSQYRESPWAFASRAPGLYVAAGFRLLEAEGSAEPAGDRDELEELAATGDPELDRMLRQAEARALASEEGSP